jgi:hypothetical protein
MLRQVHGYQEVGPPATTQTAVADGAGIKNGVGGGQQPQRPSIPPRQARANVIDIVQYNDKDNGDKRAGISITKLNKKMKKRTRRRRGKQSLEA